MSMDSKFTEPQPGSDWIVGGGNMGGLIRSMDWSRTALGPIASWPQSLRTTVNLCLASDLPICIIWGPDLVQLYNDGYRVICGDKHPRSMGQKFPECWSEAWPVIGAAHDSALAGDTAFLEDQQIFLERHGYVEETFFTFSFSPIRDETGSLAGLFHPVIETTAKMHGERRTRSLRDLASGTSNATSIDEAFALTAQSLSEYAHDLPFLLVYRFSEIDGEAHLVAATGLAAAAHGAPNGVPLPATDDASWPLDEAFLTGKPILVEDVKARFGTLSAGPFPESVDSAMLLPIVPPGAERPIGVVIVGLSPRLKPNEMYLGFHSLLSGAITTAVANADAYDAERKRAEAFAKIDRAKTEFFSNVSHEFRTPLTLMLGPLEDVLAGAGLPTHERDLIDVAHRNSLRLLKLVNSLLDFSRIEAGRAQASYEPVDLAELTSMLASNFRSVCERAGLRFLVDCSPLPEAVFVDREMWEKIVLNLLSNAFKFTFEGGVEIGLRADGEHAVLTVRDTGVGVPNEELPRMFERFHRVENQRGRSFEGSGIGLSLVQELVTLHSGTIKVESGVGEGTAFVVSIPFGTGHLRSDQIRRGEATVTTSVRASPYVEEAARWLPETASPVGWTLSAGVNTPETLSALSKARRSKVLLADDNADMRDYVQRLLGAHHDVEVVPDGEAALEVARLRRPDLIITDVMMPKLDGLGLVRAIRGDATLNDVPIIMLSARAGDDASAEGLSVGADDYLVKPFSARELITRVGALLAMANLRRENAEALRQAAEQQRLTLLLSDRLKNISDPRETVRTAAELLGRHLGVIRVGFGEIDADDVTVKFETSFADGVDPLIGSFPADNFGRGNVVELRRGLTVAYSDVTADARMSDADWASLDTRSAMGVPLIRDGRLSAILYVNDRNVRQWTPGEIALVEDVAARVWDALERARAETALRALNATLEQRVADRTAERDEVWRNSHDLMTVSTFDSVIVAVNPAWTEVLGWSEKELVGASFFNLVHPDDVAAVLVEAAKLTAGGHSTKQFENRYLRKDGGWSWLSWAVSTKDGRFYALARDITNERTRQAELEVAHEALRQSQKMEAMGQLTGGVAHDFNNLLTPVMMGLDMLRRSHGDERSQKLIGGALQSAERAKTLIQRLLTFARRQALEPSAVDPATLLSNLRDLIERSLGSTIEVAIVVGDKLPAAMIDPNQLELAILNLSVNARDAMPHGGTLTISVTSETVAPNVDRDLAPGQYIRFAVSDTGSGMDSETLARCVEPFFSTKEVGQGTGLGLAMVHGLAAQSGGVFRLTSQPGVGTEASLWIPATEQPADALVPPTSDAPTTRRSATLLLVDDEELVRGYTAEGLRTLGYAVIEAASAAKALDLVAGGLKPDLVVTDHMMPGMTGAQLAAELRSVTSSLPVLMITGYASMTPGQTLGLEVLAKPFGQAELAARVESLLERALSTISS